MMSRNETIVEYEIPFISACANSEGSWNGGII